MRGLLGNDDDDYFRELDPELDIKWFRNHPETPCWGGTWQALARDIKRTLHRNVGNRWLTCSERRMYLDEAAACIDSHPLTAAVEPGVSAPLQRCPIWDEPTVRSSAQLSNKALFAVGLEAGTCTTVAAREWFQPSRIVLEMVERVLLDHPDVTAEAGYPLHLLQGWLEESRPGEHRHLPVQLARQEARAWMNHHQE